ncbi:MAG TPA: hypothetical protein PLI09_20400 [Candidatus Hydrogenedentes bacterium]|nr:hypothetical protein [Candidatus Hydrogenedentota bacterium]
MNEETRRISWWTGALIVILSMLQPVVHLLIYYCPPEGTVPTGLHIPDSALFLQSMVTVDSKFESPYATCHAGHGWHSPVYFSMPHLLLYEGLGRFRTLGLPPFLLYGFANGVGVLCFLWVVYWLLRELFLQQAGRVFFLFVLSGGLGGVLYLLTGAIGWHEHPLFEKYFTRFALYELMEGPHLNPVLYYPRFYYTLSLAFCLGGFAALVRAARKQNSRYLYYWLLLAGIGSFINARFAVFVTGLAVLFLMFESDLSVGRRLALAAGYGIPSGLGLLAAYQWMRVNPTVMENHVQVGNMAMWLSPFITVAWLHVLLGAKPLGQSIQRLSKFGRMLGGAAMGYLAAYGMLYVAYQGYYGNLLMGLDGSVAANISDWALGGAVLGLLAAFKRPEVQELQKPWDWAALWLLLYLAVALSGWGEGWFLRFGPQRLQVFIWLPLCLFAAIGLGGLKPAFARICWSILVVCGVASVGTATFLFQGPAGRAEARGPFTHYHAEIMTEHDAGLMEKVFDAPGDMVLAPAPASDVIAMSRGRRLTAAFNPMGARTREQGNPVVFGVGSFNLTDRPYVQLKTEVDAFFNPNTPEEVRRDIAMRWCVDVVYCPDTWPVDDRTVAALRQCSWLHEIGSSGRGAVFKASFPD